jgi:hypothetical protein
MKTVKMLKGGIPVQVDGKIIIPEINQVVEVSDDDADALKRGDDATILVRAEQDLLTESEKRADEEAAAARAKLDPRTEHEQRADEEAEAARVKKRSRRGARKQKDAGNAPSNKALAGPAEDK